MARVLLHWDEKYRTGNVFEGVKETEFERQTKLYKLKSDLEIINSRPLRFWAKFHSKSRYIPEKFLRAWGIVVDFDLELPAKDGRLVEGSHQYRKSKRVMWELQGGRCGNVEKNCKNFMPTPAHGHRHHPGGRGIGGSKRDDSKTVLWCIPCHESEHDQMKLLAFKKSDSGLARCGEPQGL